MLSNQEWVCMCLSQKCHCSWHLPAVTPLGLWSITVPILAPQWCGHFRPPETLFSENQDRGDPAVTSRSGSAPGDPRGLPSKVACTLEVAPTGCAFRDLQDAVFSPLGSPPGVPWKTLWFGTFLLTEEAKDSGWGSA